MSENIIQMKTLSSLAKVFPNRIYGEEKYTFKIAKGQELSFQIAYCIDCGEVLRRECEIRISSKLDVQAYRVGFVPSLLPAEPLNYDDDYLTTLPGLFPDPLFPLGKERIPIILNTWNALWFSVKTDSNVDSGEYDITVEFIDSAGECEAISHVTVFVNEAVIPVQKLLYTNWFHCDCIASAHHVEIFSEEHWRLIGEYMRVASVHGMNMILTPVLTPPLDTEVGTYRPTVQLVDIIRTTDGYKFDFSRLERFVSMAKAYGIHTFEINHFFTQWGAKFAPKVMAYIAGEEKRIFGWDTSSDDPEYAEFLKQLVPSIIACMKELEVCEENMYFHVSDEPDKSHAEAYKKAHDILMPLIGNCRHIDALSERTYYEEKLVGEPVVASDHIESWLENTDNLWCYYCCGQTLKVSNRFMAQPSYRNRIIGVQLYKYGIKGFLQWGYNFYYTFLSRREIDPYFETDAGQRFPSGDAFCVYPYKDTAIPSLRFKVFSNALEDIRLLDLLEQRIGREEVIAAIDRIAGMQITFSSYPKDESFFDDLYQFIFDNL